MQDSATPDHPTSMFPHCSLTVHNHSKHEIMHGGLFTGLTYWSPLSHKLKALLTRPLHLDTYSIKCRSTYVHGRHGDFQRGTSASWYISVDIRTRAGGSQSGDKAGTVYIVSIVALLTVWVGKVPPNRRQQFAPT